MLFPEIFGIDSFIAYSQNKIGGTTDVAEHRASAFVVGPGNETREEMFYD
jgi:hypothetical protein